MMQVIDLARVASERIHQHKGDIDMLQQEPALVRRQSNHSEKIVIQVPVLNLSPVKPAEEAPNNV